MPSKSSNVKGFLMSRTFYAGIKMLNAEQCQKLILAFYADMGEGEMPELDPVTQAIFLMALPVIKQAQENYDKRVSTSKENGKLGGRPKKDKQNQNDETEPSGYDENQNNLNDKIGFDETDRFSENLKNHNRKEENRKEENISPPYPPLTGGEREAQDDDAVNGPGTESLGEKKNSRRFVPPTPDEVEDYCRSRRNGISGLEFCTFYASKGWMIGKNKMQDWKRAVITWEIKRNKELEAQSQNSAYPLPCN